MRKHLSFAVALAASALLAGVATATLAAAGGAQSVQAPGATAPARPQMPGMMPMNAMHERMMADMKAADAKLDGLVQQLNAAKGDARIDALVATVNELVRQSKAERAHMLEMHQMMMRGHETATSPEPSLHAH
jgi:hypothetical protein